MFIIRAVATCLTHVSIQLSIRYRIHYFFKSPLYSAESYMTIITLSQLCLQSLLSVYICCLSCFSPIGSMHAPVAQKKHNKALWFGRAIGCLHVLWIGCDLTSMNRKSLFNRSSFNSSIYLYNVGNLFVCMCVISLLCIM